MGEHYGPKWGTMGVVGSQAINLPDVRGVEAEDAKQQLRKLIRSNRLRLERSVLDAAGAAIAETTTELAKDCQTVAFYVSVDREPPTLPAIEALHRQGKKVLLPKLGPRLARAWAYFEGTEDLAQLAPGRPLEPTGPAYDSQELARVDLVITPALSVDREGNRLGQGGGWYDRALPFVAPDVDVFALCYSSEVACKFPLPHTEFDVPVSGVFTPDFHFLLRGSDFARTGQLPAF